MRPHRCLDSLRASAPPTSHVGLLLRATNEHNRHDADQALDRLEAIAGLRRALDDLADDAALSARKHGASWSVIGDALDITRQAAQQRWANISRFAGWDDC